MIGKDQCPFCNLANDNPSIIMQDRLWVVKQDAYPVVEGHLLLIPRRHVQYATDLYKNEWTQLQYFIGRARNELHQTLLAKSFNIGINMGEHAGQTIEHLHIHLIPRIKGDMEDPRGGIRNLFPDTAKYW